MGLPTATFPIFVLALVMSQSLEVVSAAEEDFGVQCQEESGIVEGEMVDITDCTRSVTTRTTESIGYNDTVHN